MQWKATDVKMKEIQIEMYKGQIISFLYNIKINVRRLVTQMQYE